MSISLSCRFIKLILPQSITAVGVKLCGTSSCDPLPPSPHFINMTYEYRMRPPTTNKHSLSQDSNLVEDDNLSEEDTVDFVRDEDSISEVSSFHSDDDSDDVLSKEL